MKHSIKLATALLALSTAFGGMAYAQAPVTGATTAGGGGGGGSPGADSTGTGGATPTGPMGKKIADGMSSTPSKKTSTTHKMHHRAKPAGTAASVGSSAG